MMEVTFINVGYGDAILVKLGSQYGLIDGGQQPSSGVCREQGIPAGILEKRTGFYA
jgi:hypothetical protein